MECGYLLAHVLEAVVPGHELGESPSCEVVLNGSVVSSPIPSTLRSENVTLPFDRGRPSQLEDMDESVVHVRAFDSRRRAVGIVVVPIGTLLPLEVWNVWYAMDEGEEDEAEEVPADLTPKLHLLLQHVPADAAALETPQQREMRAQDFLLRALQQLNASLEAKVMSHQGRSQPPEIPQAPSVPMTFSSNGFAPTPPAAASALPPAAPPAPAFLPPHTPTGSHTPPQLTTQPAFLSRSSVNGQSPMSASQSAAAALGGSGATLGVSHSVPNLERAGTSGLLAPGAPIVERGAALGLLGTASKDDAVHGRMQSYERIIASLQEKQRFYDDQEARLASLTRNLDEQQATSRTLNARLRDAAVKHQGALDAETENTRQAHASRAALEEKVVELQQEVALRKAHEDTLQRRVALMESELSVAHQKCVVVDSVEEEAQGLRRDVERHQEAKSQLHIEIGESDRQLTELREEMASVREVHQRELEQSGLRVIDARREQDVLRQSLHSCQDAARDADVKKRLLSERIEDLTRQVANLEGEVGNYKGMVAREKEHRQELERKLEEQELRRLDAALDEHRQVIDSLREQLSGVRHDEQEEQTKAAAMATEVASIRRELAHAHRQQAESRATIAQAEDVRTELQRSKERTEELRAQLQAMQQDAHKVAETHQGEISEHSRAQHVLCKERNDKQQEIGSLRLDLARAQRQVEELTMVKDQMEMSLQSAKEVASRVDELELQVQRRHEEIHEYHGRRDEIHRELEIFTTKFKDSALSQDQRAVDLEAALEERNNEIKLLMHRVQELSSKYNPCKGDAVDTVLAKWVNGYKPAVPFFRLSQGLYLFGRRQVICKITNDKPVFRVGGSFIGFDKFLELYASEELERLLNYDMDERTGDPKFLEAQRLQKAMDDSGYLAELRARAEQTAQSRHRSSIGK